MEDYFEEFQPRRATVVATDNRLKEGWVRGESKQICVLAEFSQLNAERAYEKTVFWVIWCLGIHKTWRIGHWACDGIFEQVGIVYNYEMFTTFSREYVDFQHSIDTALRIIGDSEALWNDTLRL